MDSILRDIRYALRTLRKQPGFTAAVVVTLGLGIGASTAIFSLIDAALLRPLPFRESERVVFLWGVFGPEREVRGASLPEAMEWREMSRTLSSLSVYSDVSLNLRIGDDARRLQGEIVSGNYFDVLGTKPHLGRGFLPEEDRTPDSHPVAIISDGLWKSTFAGDPSVVGSTISLNERAFTVIGVAPEGFRGLSFTSDVWIPIQMATVVGRASLLGRGTRWLGAVARLEDGVPIDVAQSDLDDVAARLEQLHPGTNRQRGILLQSLHAWYLGDTGRLLVVIFGAVLLFLLIACANVTSLQLVRAATRRREIALRIALGAHRKRLIQQLLTEGIVLAMLGAGAGILVALWSLDALLPFVPDGVLPAYVRTTVDARVLGFTTAVAVVSGIVFGLVPALQSFRLDLTSSLKEGAHSMVGGVSVRRFGMQQALVVAEIALALVLLISAGLMVRSFRQQLAVDPGFRASGVLTARVSLPVQRYDAIARELFVDRLVARLRALPGVQSATVASELPLSGSTSAAFIHIAEKSPDGIRYYRHSVTPDYFATLGIRLARGRAFTADDRRETPLVAVINEAMATRFWQNEDPVGKRFRLGNTDGPEVTIVGVAANARFRSLTASLAAPRAEPDVYFPYAQRSTEDLQIAVRSGGSATALADLMRREVSALDAGLPIFDVRPLSKLLEQQTGTGRFGSLVLAVFSSVALLLAAVGIYGVLAFVVSRSAREIAIRMALGASGSSVLRLMVRHGMTLVGVGLILGLLGAALATGALSSQLFNVSPTDPATFAGISLVLIAVSLLATYIPARRATKIDPQRALKGE